MFTIENDKLRVSIAEKGAELTRIFSKETGLEYLWSGDPTFWSKQSPVLFPIVGTLKQNRYRYRGEWYTMGRHGFARDRQFVCSVQEKERLTMSLVSDEESLKVFPFHFRLDITYTVHNDQLKVQYEVTNTSDNDMYFSIGGHPAFRVPLEEGLDYDDYYLEFAQIENAMRWLISREGLIEPMPVPFLVNNNRLDLTKELFRKDAIVFKHLNSDVVSLRSKKSAHGIAFSFPRFPFMGIWAAPDADFVCIEPWCGIADSTTTEQLLENKEGINFLSGGQVFERAWEVRMF